MAADGRSVAQVLSVAQAREGRLVAMKLLVHAFAGPVLALLADSIGRRPVLLLGHDFMGDLGTMAV